ncbi:MAG: alpha/beta fold hydrolase [Gaiellaceae bacterium]
MNTVAAHVALVPGGVLPGELAYGPLLAALGRDAEPLVKDLELYAGDTPPAGYTLDHEVEGIRRAVDERGFQTFHLVGYSAGGAACLAFVARYPERVRSLALIEPAWIGNNDLSPEEVEDWRELDRMIALPPEEMMREFVSSGTPPGAASPEPAPGPPPPWMAKRPAGLRALIQAFKAFELDHARLREFDGPVYLALGTLSIPVEERKIERLGRIFANAEIDRYEGRHHFDPPHRAEADRFAGALQRLWSRSGTADAIEPSANVALR